MRKDLISGYPKRHNAYKIGLKKIEVWEKAKKKILASVRDEVMKN